MAGPDLTAAVARVLSLMDDRCTVASDPQGVRDDILDEVTGLLTPPVGDTTSAPWPCLITPQTAGDQTPEATAATAKLTGNVYRMLLPLDADLAGGELVTVTFSARDPKLLGARFRADAPADVSSYPVARIVRVVRL